MKSVERAYDEFADGLHSSYEESEFRRVGQRVAEGFGFRYFAYLGLGCGGTRLISSYPKRWSDHYFAEGYDQVDPVLAFARQDKSLMRWSGEMDGLQRPRQEQRLFDDASEFGIRAGVTVAIAGGFQRSAAFTMAVDERNRRHDEFIDQATDILQVIGHLFHAHADARLSSRTRVGKIALTQRERECLRWAARGKSMDATGSIVGITPRAVKFHLDNARANLGAETLPQAVAIALRGRAIS